MADLDKTIKGLDCCSRFLCPQITDSSEQCPYCKEGDCVETLEKDALELLKEKQGISVDAFLQWCVESHRMGDASRKCIEYWINEFKAWKQKAKDGEQE